MNSTRCYLSALVSISLLTFPTLRLQAQPAPQPPPVPKPAPAPAGQQPAGGDKGVAFLKSLGVTYALDHRKPGYMNEVLELTNGKGPALIIEMLANANLVEDLRIAAHRGRVVIVGSRGLIAVDPRVTVTKDLTVRGMSLFNMTDAEREHVHADLAAGFASGTLKPLIGAKAHAAILVPGARGKIVLIP